MILKRFYNEKLAQASFLIGSSGEAIVVDPNRHISQYTNAAKEEGLKIIAVTETHIHADFISGSLELAAETGATIYLSDEGAPEWKYDYANQPNVKVIRNGGSIRIGNVLLEALSTPGHTPEHLAFSITDEEVSPEPTAVLTGDFIFIGDVGRPDLLERAVGIEGATLSAAKTLYNSIQKFLGSIDGSVTILPGHGAGSACGKNLGTAPSNILAEEKLTNWALKEISEEEFLEEIMAGQPEPPRYFKEMKRINKEGAAIVGKLSPAMKLGKRELSDCIRHENLLIDVRPSASSMQGFITNSIVIPFNKAFLTWCGSILPYGEPFYLVAESQEQADQAKYDLELIGIDEIRGWFGEDSFPEQLETTTQISAETAHKLIVENVAAVLDVRNRSEFASGHIIGANNIPLGELNDRLSEVPQDKKIIVHCEMGGRSVVAYSLLKREGFTELLNLKNGFQEYLSLKYPVA